MNCIRRRMGRNFVSFIEAMSVFSIRTAPLVGFTSRATQRAAVDAGTRFADNAERFPTPHRQRHVANRVDDARLRLKTPAVGLEQFSVCSTTGPLTGARFGGVMLGTAASSILA
jgi:hypothetical protein